MGKAVSSPVEWVLSEETSIKFALLKSEPTSGLDWY